MKFPDSLAKLGVEPITHENVKSYTTDFLLGLQIELSETIRNTKRKDWQEAKYYGHVLNMVKTEIEHRKSIRKEKAHV